jgi:hypothetical protein
VSITTSTPDQPPPPPPPALRPSRQESQTAQRRPLEPDTNSRRRRPPPPQSCTVRAATLRVSARRSTSSLSLLDLFWLPAHALCLLYYSSPQSCIVRAATLRVRHFPPKPLEELHRCSPSVCDHFVRDSARVSLPLTVTVQHRLLPRANVSRMYAECFDKVLYHVNSRILKCKMTNVITRFSMLYSFYMLTFQGVGYVLLHKFGEQEDFEGDMMSL